MPAQHTFARSLHDIGLAGWFGGSLMGAVGLNGASDQASDPRERAAVANAGWARWTPVNAAAVAAHLLGGAQLVRGNKARLAMQPQARWVNASKAGLTLAALGATAYSRWLGQQLMDADDTTAANDPTGPRPGDTPDEAPVDDAVTPLRETPDQAARAQQQLSALQWVVPASTGALLVLNAKAGEQQRPGVILLDRVRAGVPLALRAAPTVVAALPWRSLPWKAIVGAVLGLIAATRLRHRDDSADHQRDGSTDEGRDQQQDPGHAATAGSAGAAGAQAGRQGRRGWGGRRRARRRSGPTARDIMTSEVTSVAPQDSLQTAARHMVDENIGALPVRANGRVEGMLTDRDIVTHVVAAGGDLSSTTVGDIATTSPTTVDADDPVRDVVQIMASGKVRRVPVVEEGRLVGIISQADVARTGDDDVTGDLVEMISTAR